MSVHEGHRQRKKEQFREHGLDAFADHEALELLLYYAIPRQDTNPIAHRLIERFGSLEGVFSAPAYELQKVEGVGENAATLIRLLFPLCRRVRTSGGRHEVIFARTSARISSSCSSASGGRSFTRPVWTRRASCSPATDWRRVARIR